MVMRADGRIQDTADPLSTSLGHTGRGTIRCVDERTAKAAIANPTGEQYRLPDGSATQVDTATAGRLGVSTQPVAAAVRREGSWRRCLQPDDTQQGPDDAGQTLASDQPGCGRDQEALCKARHDAFEHAAD